VPAPFDFAQDERMRELGTANRRSASRKAGLIHRLKRLADSTESRPMAWVKI